jgi:hypothetical protein
LVNNVQRIKVGEGRAVLSECEVLNKVSLKIRGMKVALNHGTFRCTRSAVICRYTSGVSSLCK